MDELKRLKDMLEGRRPVEWEGFPDIGLYKDQVVSYLKRQLINPEDDGQLTPAMISNYIKDKLLPKADGKKYNKEHLAILTEISLLKQVLQVKDIRFLLNEETQNKNTREFYEDFIKSLDKSLGDIAGRLDADSCDGESKSDIVDMAFNFAIESYCAKLVCESLIKILRGENDSDPKNSKK